MEVPNKRPNTKEEVLDLVRELKAKYPTNNFMVKVAGRYFSTEFGEV